MLRVTIQQESPRVLAAELDAVLAADRDRSLVGAYLAGDDDAFSLIVEDHYDVLRVQARRLLGPYGQADDAVQETFERALKGIHRFGLKGEYRLGAWLNRILVNVCSDQRTRRSRDVRIVQAAQFQIRPQGDIADTVSDPAEMARLQSALRSLPSTHRQAWVLRELRGLPYAAVAEEENITVENARARVSRAKSSLQSRLGSVRPTAAFLAGFPFLRRLSRSSAGSDAVASNSGSGVSGLVEKLASQIAATPFGQTAMALVSTAPRGTMLVGVAATVATVSLSTTVLNPVPPGAPQPQRQVSLSALPVVAPLQTTPASSPVTTSAASNQPPQLSPPSTVYSWVDPSTSTAPLAATALPAATCASGNGVPIPGSGFNYGTPLGMANAVSVANVPSTDLPSLGPSTALSETTSLTNFEGSVAAVPITIDFDACLANGGWFTAAIGVPGSTASSAVLQGTLTDVIGSAGDLGYIFRGTVTPSDGVSIGSLDATQFVAQLIVAEPANTAQLTIVFLSPDPLLGANLGSSGTAGSPSAPSGTQATGSDPSTPPSGSSDPPASTVSDLSELATIGQVLQVPSQTTAATVSSPSLGSLSSWQPVSLPFALPSTLSLP